MNVGWYDDYSWLHWDSDCGKLFCFYCLNARQGLPIRGHTDKSGNFYELIMLRSTDNPEVGSFLKCERFVYTCHEIQNKILQLITHSVLRSLIANISKARIFSLIVDETNDQSTDEQVSVCVRYVNDEIQPNEIFLGLHETADTRGESLFNMIIDVLTRSRLSLPVDNLHGQCYDGASSMCGQLHRATTSDDTRQSSGMAEYTTLVPTTSSVGSTGVLSLTVLLSAALLADSAVTNVCTPGPSDNAFVHDKLSAYRRRLYGQNVTELQSRISITAFAGPASVGSDDGEVAPVSCLDLATSPSDFEPRRPTSGIPPPARPR